MRYFRATVTVYESICSQLDAAYGYPNADTKTMRALPLPQELPSDASGRIYLALADEYCDYTLPSEMLPQLLANGVVQEIVQAEYKQAIE